MPPGLRSSVTSGLSIIMRVMLRSLCKIRGSSSTPTLTDFAVRNGELLNLGSSAMDKLSAASEPLKSERLRLPTSTLRPRAAEAFSSIVGRNWFTGIRKGATSTRTTRTATMIRTTRSVRRMEQPPDWQGREREREHVVARAILAYRSQIPPTGEPRCNAGADGKIGAVREAAGQGIHGLRY